MNITIVQPDNVHLSASMPACNAIRQLLERHLSCLQQQVNNASYQRQFANKTMHTAAAAATAVNGQQVLVVPHAAMWVAYSSMVYLCAMVCL